MVAKGLRPVSLVVPFADRNAKHLLACLLVDVAWDPKVSEETVQQAEPATVSKTCLVEKETQRQRPWLTKMIKDGKAIWRVCPCRRQRYCSWLQERAGGGLPEYQLDCARGLKGTCMYFLVGPVTSEGLRR